MERFSFKLKRVFAFLSGRVLGYPRTLDSLYERRVLQPEVSFTPERAKKLSYLLDEGKVDSFCLSLWKTDCGDSLEGPAFTFLRQKAMEGHLICSAESIFLGFDLLEKSAPEQKPVIASDLLVGLMIFGCLFQMDRASVGQLGSVSFTHSLHEKTTKSLKGTKITHCIPSPFYIILRLRELF